jgi:DNA-binding Lrp family transcriptional regulator
VFRSHGQLRVAAVEMAGSSVPRVERTPGTSRSVHAPWSRWRDEEHSAVAATQPFEVAGQPLLEGPLEHLNIAVLAESTSLDRVAQLVDDRLRLAAFPKDRRAVFVLHQVFEMPYGEIAAAVGKSAAAVRQIALRAREHVAARRPRVQVSRSEQQAVVERFLAALRTGKLQDLMDVMAPDVVLIADGGGIAAAARVPIHGAGAVANLLARAHRVLAAFETTPMWLNGAPAVRVAIDGQVAAVSLVVENGRVTRINAVANPQKLTRLDEPAELVR